MTPEEQQAGLERALQDWLDHKFATFGKWTAAAIALAAFGMLIYAMLYIGWRPSV